MRKHTYPPKFEKLTPEQIKTLDLWLEEHPYRVAQEKLAAEFGVLISINKLCRYLQHRELAEEINDETDLNISARELYKVLNGDPVPYDEATLHLIAKQVFFQALKPDLSLSKLALIHRLATYKQTLELKQRRLALEEAKRDISPAPVATPAAPSQATPVPVQPAPSSATPQPTAQFTRVDAALDAAPHLVPAPQVPHSTAAPSQPRRSRPAEHFYPEKIAA